LQLQKERVFDLDNFRRGKSSVNEASIFRSPQHNASLWTVEAGHTLSLEKRPDERIILVMGGMGEYRSADGDSRLLDADMLAVVPPGESHEIHNTGIGPLVILSIEGNTQK
jgi:mannose-6-phosphate isomerase-like protein (cupin superfamily)